MYDVDVALSYYDVWLMRLGYYPDSVWEQIRPTAKLRHHWEVSRVATYHLCAC